MSKIDFSRPQRQSAKGLVLIFLQEGRKLIKTFWPVLVAIVFTNKTRNRWLEVAAFLLTGLVLTLIHTILYYLTFKFHIENGQFILRKGYIKRKTLTIPFDRIQNVNTRQSILQQVFGVMSLEIDTAGTDQKELKINSLKTNVATQLALLLGNALETRTDKTEEEDMPVKPSEELLLKLKISDLLRIGISQNHIKTAILLFVFGIQFYYQIEDYFKEQAQKYANELWTFLSHSGLTILIILLVGFLLFSLLFSMVRTAVLFYDLRFYRISQSYRIVSGLLTRKNLLLPFRKIQDLNWETGPVKRLFGIYKVVIHQASGGITPENKFPEVPGCLINHIETIRKDLFGADQLLDQPLIYSSSYYWRRTWLRYGWIPALLATPLLLLNWHYVFILILWVVYILIHSRLMIGKSYFQITNQQILVSSGAFSHRFKQMDLSKVQHVEFRQGVFIKKRGLATLVIGNAASTMRLPFIDAGIARRLHDYLLYYAETSTSEWI
ncbi:MAG: PH domain-containing protein [Bacteroidales bacterium]|jgi:putative membrane protein